MVATKRPCSVKGAERAARYSFWLAGLGARRALRAEHGIGEGSQQRASFISRRAHRHIAVVPRSFLISRCLSKYCKSHLPRSSLRRCWALLQISAKSSWSKSRRSFCMAQLHEIFGRKRCTLVRVLIPSVRFRVFSWVGENGFVNPAELFRGLGRMKQLHSKGYQGRMTRIEDDCRSIVALRDVNGSADRRPDHIERNGQLPVRWLVARHKWL